ncbi:MAG: hypothetical protein WC100_02440 [Sterolibacterium sp.]
MTGEIMSATIEPSDVPDVVSKAMRRAWQLGQTYWRQADSESFSQQKKSDETQHKFEQLIDETRAQLTQTEKRCPHCDGSGDVHRADGEWLGTCTCPAGTAQAPAAFCHDGQGRFDVCHAKIKQVLIDAGLQKQVEHYTIPLYLESGDRMAYEGAREDLLDWKRRALEAEAALRQPTHFVVAKQHPTRDEVSIFPTDSVALANEYKAIGWTVLPLTASALEHVLDQPTQTDVEGMAEARAIAIYEAVHHDAAKRMPWAHLPPSEWEAWRRASNSVQQIQALGVVA